MKMAPPHRIYTVDEANALVPEVRAILLQMGFEEGRVERVHEELHRRLEGNGDPASRAVADRLEAEMTEISEGIRTLFAHLRERGIMVRDLEMGLVDFPAEREGRRVWLCWRLADPTVAYWHGTDEGYASRRPW
jgi:hypothetical protein